MSIPLILMILSSLFVLVCMLSIDDMDLAGPLVAMATTVFLVSLVLSFAISQDPPKITDTSVFRLEKTPYRLIITAFGKETVYTDAYTVAQADKIVAVRQTLPQNVWGIDLTSFMVITPVLRGETK